MHSTCSSRSFDLTDHHPSLSVEVVSVGHLPCGALPPRARAHWPSPHGSLPCVAVRVNVCEIDVVFVDRSISRRGAGGGASKALLPKASRTFILYIFGLWLPLREKHTPIKAAQNKKEKKHTGAFGKSTSSSRLSLLHVIVVLSVLACSWPHRLLSSQSNPKSPHIHRRRAVRRAVGGLSKNTGAFSWRQSLPPTRLVAVTRTYIILLCILPRLCSFVALNIHTYSQHMHACIHSSIHPPQQTHQSPHGPHHSASSCRRRRSCSRRRGR